MNHKNCLFIIVALIAFFALPGGIHADMKETDTDTLRQIDYKAKTVIPFDGYIYAVVKSSPPRVINVEKSHMKEASALTLNFKVENEKDQGEIKRFSKRFPPVRF